jgi:hypothetical protein
MGGLVGKTAGSLLVDQSGADAAQNAAHDKYNQATKNYDTATGYRNDLIKNTEAPTVNAMASMQKGIDAQDRDLSRQEQMISQIDPAILEASNQALSIMRGDQNNSYSRSRTLQRQKLLQSLREQLGPGAETSSAGLKALAMFDQSTDQGTFGAAQGYTGLAQSFSGIRPNVAQSTSNLGNLNANQVGLRLNQQSLVGNANKDVLAMGSGMADTAGWENVAGVIKGQNNNAMTNSLINGAVQVGSSYLKGGA